MVGRNQRVPGLGRLGGKVLGTTGALLKHDSWRFLLCGSQNSLETGFGDLSLFWRGLFPQTGLLVSAQLPAVASG